MRPSRTGVLIALLGTVILVLPPAAAGGVAEPSASCAQGLVALTFDDGPRPGVTPALLDVLENRHVPATFFMLGERVAAMPKVVARAGALGFPIGNHTYRHQDLTKLPDPAVERTLRRTRRAIVAAGAAPSRLMRPPFGRLDPRVRALVRGLGLTPVLWTVDPQDWAGGSGRAIADRVLSGLRPWWENVVLLHDGVANSPNTLAAVPRIVHRARRLGYCFARLGPGGHPVPPDASGPG